MHVRELKVNLKDLTDAFDNGFAEVAYYLDLETGEVVMVTEESRQLLEELSGAEQAETLEAALEAIRSADIPQWEMDVVCAAAVVEWEDDDRFLKIPRVESWEGYQDMADFIETVSDAHVQEILEVAIQGKGAFRRFKDTLERYPKEREHWFEFLDARSKERVLNWLREEEIQPLETDTDRQSE
jgi:hypothetical protein